MGWLFVFGYLYKRSILGAFVCRSGARCFGSGRGVCPLPADSVVFGVVVNLCAGADLEGFAGDVEQRDETRTYQTAIRTRGCLPPGYMHAHIADAKPLFSAV